jgi:hypothetical protein
MKPQKNPTKVDRVLGLLLHLRNFFYTPNRWLKGELKGPSGRVCLLGGLEEVMNRSKVDPNLGDRFIITAELEAAIKRNYGHRYSHVPDFNDDGRTKFKDVQKVIDDAIEHRQKKLAH